jgi:hypothetical protein
MSQLRRLLRRARPHAFALAALAAGLATAPLAAQARLTSPRQAFGFDIGADYRLVNYTQYERWVQQLARDSDRVEIERIGTSAEGRAIWMLIVSDPANLRDRERYRRISERLARAEFADSAEARRLAREGKAIVWIDGGLHATEVLGAQQTMETAWQLATGADDETRRLLRETIVLISLVNPDGMELVSDWYNREADTLKRSTADIPRLYQKYIGHDNNRDFFLNSQPETRAVNRVFYRRWHPQIVYNHHQTGPAGTVMFAPPFRDPFNFTVDPLVLMQLDQVGAAMHARFAAEGKPGVTMRSGAGYSTWWNGGLRTTVYFHNMVGLLTETIGNPTPIEIPLVPQNQLPRGDLPAPIAPQRWRFRQSIDYSVTANKAVIDVAARYRETFLFNAWRMGRNQIARGSTDSWTIAPKRIDAMRAKAEADRIAEQANAGNGRARAEGPAQSTTLPARYFDELRKPEQRDPRAYVLTAAQPDPGTVRRFLNALWYAGVDIDRATAPFTAGGVSYPAGSHVIRTAQAFRAHVLDMFEPQDHPNDFAYPGGPPRPPYDNAGWTLALQMGVRFERVLEPFDAPTERLRAPAAPEPGTVAATTIGWYLGRETTDAYKAVNRLLAKGLDVRVLDSATTAAERRWSAGSWFVPASAAARSVLEGLAKETGLSFAGAESAPRVPHHAQRPVRLGLWDTYGGSMPSGWLRYILEEFEFPYEVVFPQALDAGNLRARFDVLLFPDGAIPARDAGETEGRFRQPKPEEIPAEYRDRLGRVTVATTLPQLRAFAAEGGTLLAIGSSTNVGALLGLPVENALTEVVDGRERPLPREKFYVPGSLLEATVDTLQPLARGVGRDGRVIVFYDNSPVFRLTPDAAAKGVVPAAWFGTATPLRSGWAWGEAHLAQGVQVVDAPYGLGRVVLYGPEITFRAQPHGTFKFLFNGVLRAGE